MQRGNTMGFSFTFHLYGFIIELGLALGYFLSRRTALSKGADMPLFDRIFLVAVAGGLAGARLYHVLDRLGYYSMHPWEILFIWNGGLAIFGAIIGGVIAVVLLLVFSREVRMFLRWSDIFVPGVLLAQVIGRWGNFVNEEAFGYPSNLPWSVYVSPEKRPADFQEFSYFQPLFLYESLWNLAGLFILLKWKRVFSKNGLSTAFYLIWYGFGRFFYEFGRFDTAIVFGIKLAQLISLLSIVLGLVILAWTRRDVVGKMVNGG